MPVTTRNQRLNNVASLEKLQAPKPVANQQVIGKVRPDTNNLLPWFTSVFKERMNEIDKIIMIKINLQHMINHRQIIQKRIIEKRIRLTHFDTIRQITEVMFFVDQYLPEVYNLYPLAEKFTKTVYEKVQDLYNQIRTSNLKPETDDEYKAVAAMITVLQDVEKNIIPLLPRNVLLKRRRNFVDYTGMDTIEPLDGITNIWYDLTLAEDPNYEPTEDEDEDEDEDEEEEEEQEQEDKEQPQKVRKSDNHILFVYDDE